ncbi:MAG TPA: hypothetical protein VGN93_10275 [Shinella sp.]|nr:hypothetical protein [Shinella sp.]
MLADVEKVCHREKGRVREREPHDGEADQRDEQELVAHFRQD